MHANAIQFHEVPFVQHSMVRDARSVDMLHAAPNLINQGIQSVPRWVLRQAIDPLLGTEVILVRGHHKGAYARVKSTGKDGFYNVELRMQPPTVVEVAFYDMAIEKTEPNGWRTIYPFDPTRRVTTPQAPPRPSVSEETLSKVRLLEFWEEERKISLASAGAVTPMPDRAFMQELGGTWVTTPQHPGLDTPNVGDAQAGPATLSEAVMTTVEKMVVDPAMKRAWDGVVMQFVVRGTKVSGTPSYENGRYEGHIMRSVPGVSIEGVNGADRAPSERYTIVVEDTMGKRRGWPARYLHPCPPDVSGRAVVISGAFTGSEVEVMAVGPDGVFRIRELEHEDLFGVEGRQLVRVHQNRRKATRR